MNMTFEFDLVFGRYSIFWHCVIYVFPPEKELCKRFSPEFSQVLK